MNIVTISGGLGNQMFQYAFCTELEQYSSKIYTTDYLIKRENAHNGYELKNVFNIDLRTKWGVNLLIRLIRKLLLFRNTYIAKTVFRLLKFVRINLILEDENFKLDIANITKKHRINILWGYWQSEYFFKNSIDKIRRLYCFNHSLLSLKTREVLCRIKDTQSVSIHIRRGDYLLDEYKDTLGSVCTLKYYHLAIDYINAKIENPFFFVFSNDIEWAKENIVMPNVEFIFWNKNKDSWQDMFLMSECKHNIIANSTFSWWGAWLNRNRHKMVIAPAGYLYPYKTNLQTIPSDWIRI